MLLIFTSAGGFSTEVGRMAATDFAEGELSSSFGVEFDIAGGFSTTVGWVSSGFGTGGADLSSVLLGCSDLQFTCGFDWAVTVATGVLVAVTRGRTPDWLGGRGATGTDDADGMVGGFASGVDILARVGSFALDFGVAKELVDLELGVFVWECVADALFGWTWTPRRDCVVVAGRKVCGAMLATSTKNKYKKFNDIKPVVVMETMWLTK